MPWWVVVGAGLLLSLLVHVGVFWPLMGDFLGRPGEGHPPPEPVEVTWEPDPQRVAEAPRPPARDVPVERERPRPRERIAPETPPQRQARPKKRLPPRRRARPKKRPPPRLKKRPRPRPRKRPRPRPKKRPRPRPVQVKLNRMKMVDQDNPKDEPKPKDAKYLAQKNRDVKQQTRARHTNLDRHSKQTHLPAKARKKIGALTRQKKNETRLPQRAPRERAGAPRRGPRPRARPRVTPRRAQPAQKPRRAGLLAMRNRKKDQDRDVLKPDKTRLSPRGTLSVRRPRARPQPRRVPPRRPGSRVARRRLKLRLTPQDADRVFGKQWAAQWRKRHRRRGSKGPKSKRWKRIKAALENYVPEVKVGNQTALKTRAHPYARYIAAMHRKIHPLWGHGFLEDLDRLPAHNAFNDWSRHTKIEMVLDNRGRLVKAGVVKPSGFLPFDVAALDVVFQAAPFGAPPPAIRSPDGRVYLHWGFYRNHRQCGTFNVDPFILASPPGGRQDRASAKGAPPRPRRSGRALRRRQGGSATGEARPSARGREARRAGRQLGATLDPKAKGPAAAWITGFLQGKVNRMLRASAVPFDVGGRQRATSHKQLRGVYLALIAETPDRHLERSVQLHTAAGLRQRLGTLPRGVQPGAPHLYVVARYMKNDLVLILGKRDGRWAVIGLAR